MKINITDTIVVSINDAGVVGYDNTDATRPNDIIANNHAGLAMAGHRSYRITNDVPWHIRANAAGHTRTDYTLTNGDITISVRHYAVDGHDFVIIYLPTANHAWELLSNTNPWVGTESFVTNTDFAPISVVRG